MVAKGANKQSEIPLVDLINVPREEGGNYLQYSLFSIALADVMGIDVGDVITRAREDFPLKL